MVFLVIGLLTLLNLGTGFGLLALLAPLKFRQQLDPLERLLALNADILCEGHYGIFRSKPVVARFIHSCLNAALGP